jgi:hypothetical protein
MKPMGLMTMMSSLISFVQSFGVAPFVLVWFLWTVAILGFLETLRQERKLKKAERERSQRLAPPRLSR